MEWQSYEWEFAGEVLAKAVAAAQSEIPVLLIGETGTGHEAVARYIHSHSRRVEEPFESVNCASLPDAVLARRLMGWEKGFDRDAREPFKGLIGLGGVLFLYPIEPIGARSESVLRRLLQTGEYQPLGAAQPLKADVRLVAATNTEPETAVARGEISLATDVARSSASQNGTWRGWVTRGGSLESASPHRHARLFSLTLGRVTCVSSTTSWDARWRNPMVARSRLMIFQAA